MTEIIEEPISLEGSKLVDEFTSSAATKQSQHPGKIQDALERSSALDHLRSFIVQAPAGSGKTSLLTQRFLKLLAYVDNPEECLAITFTKKAACEMRDRVLTALNQAEQNLQPSTNNPYEQQTFELAKAVCKRDKEKSWDLFQNPNRLKIQTIDAFCLSLTRQMPILSTFGAIPKIIEDASPLYRLAASNLLKNLELSDKSNSSNSQAFVSHALGQLLRHLDNNLGLAERFLAELLPYRDQWLPTIGQTYLQLSTQDCSAKIREALESNLKDIVQETLVAFMISLPTCFNEIIELAHFAANQLATMQQSSSIIALQNIPTNFGSESTLTLQTPCSTEELLQHLSIAQGLKELLLTKEFTWRKTLTEQQGFPAPSKTKDKEDKAFFAAMKERMQNVLCQLAEYPNFRDHLQKVCECPSIIYSDEQWQINEILVQLLPILTAELSLVFQEEGQVDFVEVSLNAQKSLGAWDEPTDLALGLDYRINHILVDEFQDTSLTQFRLLEQLTAGWQPTDGKTLFLVGDPMQSIYRFRQAEVGLFIRARERGVGSIPLNFLRLSTNFRSEPMLIEWFNQTFNSLFPTQDDITSSAITFSASTPALTGQGHAEVQTVTKDTEASQVVELIQKARQKDEGASIAILVRARSHLQDILPALQKNHIEYQGLQLERLFDHPIIQDLFSLTRALLHPCDRIAWLSILRAPWCRLSLQDLWIIANPHLFTSEDNSKTQASTKRMVPLPLMFTLQSYQTLSKLSAAAIKVLENQVPVLQWAIEFRGRLSLRDLIQETWIRLGGPSTVNFYDQNFIQDIEAFFDILEAIGSSREDPLEVLETKLASHFASPKTTTANAVQIMTIHKAKGLEFDTVIVPGVGRKSMADPKKLFLWENRAGLLKESYLILAPIQSLGGLDDPIYTYLRKQEAIRAQHELQRLWYVAATRARKQLYWLKHEAIDLIKSTSKIPQAKTNFTDFMNQSPAKGIDLDLSRDMSIMQEEMDFDHCEDKNN